MQRAEVVDVADELKLSSSSRDCNGCSSMDGRQRRWAVAAALLALAVGIALGVLAAFAATRGPAIALDRLTRNSYAEDKAVTERIVDSVDRNMLRKVLDAHSSV